MSFQISPEAIIFSLRSQIPSLQQQITDLENNIVELPEPIFRTIEVRNIQGFFSGDTKQVLIFNPNLTGIQRGNTELNIKISELKKRISSINSQINLLEKEVEIRQIKSIDLQEIELLPKQNNTLRNALLIGGALLIL